MLVALRFTRNAVVLRSSAALRVNLASFLHVEKYDYIKLLATSASILKSSRARGTRSSKYSPVYESIRALKDREFVVLRSVEKSAKLSLYQGIKRNFPDDEVRMASARQKDADGERYVIVIGKTSDYNEMRELARAS